MEMTMLIERLEFHVLLMSTHTMLGCEIIEPGPPTDTRLRFLARDAVGSSLLYLR